jgi:hypothetical protein
VKIPRRALGREDFAHITVAFGAVHNVITATGGKREGRTYLREWGKSASALFPLVATMASSSSESSSRTLITSIRLVHQHSDPAMTHQGPVDSQQRCNPPHSPLSRAASMHLPLLPPPSLHAYSQYTRRRQQGNPPPPSHTLPECIYLCCPLLHCTC